MLDNDKLAWQFFDGREECRPNNREGASLKKMLNEIEALTRNGYTVKSITECNGEIFAFLVNERELKQTQS